MSSPGLTEYFKFWKSTTLKFKWIKPNCNYKEAFTIDQLVFLVLDRCLIEISCIICKGMINLFIFHLNDDYGATYSIFYAFCFYAWQPPTLGLL